MTSIIIDLALASRILTRLNKLYTVKVFGKVVQKENLDKIITKLKVIQRNGQKDDDLAAECGGYAYHANILMDEFQRANGQTRSLKPIATKEIENQLKLETHLVEVQQLRLAFIAFSAIRFRCADGNQSTIKRPQ